MRGDLKIGCSPTNLRPEVDFPTLKFHRVRLETIPAWNLEKVKSREEVIRAAQERQKERPIDGENDVARVIRRNRSSQCLFNSEEVEAKWWLRDGSSLLVKPECLRTRHRW